ncbi:MAG: formate dehydrogenase accessory sulfurtransferase FdhD [Rhodocyclaceae bacterium]|nr:formate dehydrogenase accessory sulfurtransferase FdhD [Rhodocyclaceae bacterium]
MFSPANGMAEVGCQQLFLDARPEPAGQRICVVQEDVLTIEVEDVGLYSLMWTPTTANAGPVGYTDEDGLLLADASMEQVPESLALATGFSFTEGIIGSLADVKSMAVCPSRQDVVTVRLLRPDAAAVQRRNVVVNSSCGVCGGREQLAASLSRGAACTDLLRATVEDLAEARAQLQNRQSIFRHTGGTHGAILFDQGMNVLAVAEDLGRHNALDKVIGQRLLQGLDFSGCGAFISSRVSYEMVAKAVRAGLEIVAAISAPSSLAIELADIHGITLCGFVRDHRATVFTHPHRIVRGDPVAD